MAEYLSRKGIGNETIIKEFDKAISKQLPKELESIKKSFIMSGAKSIEYPLFDTNGALSYLISNTQGNLGMTGSEAALNKYVYYACVEIIGNFAKNNKDIAISISSFPFNQWKRGYSYFESFIGITVKFEKNMALIPSKR